MKKFLLITMIFMALCTLKTFADSPAAEEYNKGIRLMEQQDWELAESLLNRAVEIDGDYLEARTALADVKFHRGDYKGAIEQIQYVLEKNDRFHTAWYVLAGIYSKQYRDSALETIDKAIAIEPNRSDYYLMKANLLSRNQEYANAEKAYRKALELAPMNYAAMANLALCCFNQGRTEEAMEINREVMNLTNPPYQGLIVNGIILARTGDTATALRVFKDAADQKPLEPHAYYNLALIQIEQGINDEGEMNLKKAGELDEFFAPAYLALGQLYRRQRRTAEALEILEKAKNTDPEEVNTYLELGALYLDMADPDSALAHLGRAVLIAPDNPVARIALGSAYRLMNRFDDSLKEYKRAQALDPEIPQIYYNLANLCEDRGLNLESAENLEKYLELCPHDPDSESIMKRIKILRESAVLK